MDWQTQRLYYNLCNPDQPLPPDNERNVDLDHFGDRDHPVRGVDWSRKLAAGIEFAVADPSVEAPAYVLFSGLPGSGKTTELLRLQKRLSRKDGANLLTVYIDGSEYLDLTDSIDISDLRIAILHAVARRVAEAEGQRGDKALDEGIFDRLGQLLGRLSLGGPKLNLPAGASLALDLKVQASLRQEVRRRVAEHTTAFLAATALELAELRARAVQLGYAGVVVLFDSLEKLRGTSERFDTVLGSAENLFSQGGPYLQLPVHVLYTVPPALILRLRANVQFMPMIKLWDREGAPFAPGMAAARKIIDSRIPDRAVLHEIFGTGNDAALEDRLQRLIAWSAGYPREIVRLLRSAVQEAPLSEAIFDRLLGQAGDEYRRLLLLSDLDWLAQVALSHQITPRDEEQRRAAARMLSNNVVLRYHNTTEWYDVHPAVREMPALKERVKKLLESAGG